MTQPSVGPEQRKVDALNADMRGGYTAPEFGKFDDIDEILRKHLRVTGENANLRAELAQARKARDAAQELLEAERQKSAHFESVARTANTIAHGIKRELEKEQQKRAKIEADGAQQAFSMGEAMGAAIREKAAIQEKIGVLEKEREFLLTDNRENRSAKYRLMSALDTEKLLRANDAATIADLERRLKEAEAQLKAQREAAPRMYIAARGQATVAQGYWHDIQALQAENAGLHETVKSQEVTIRQLKAQIEVMPVTVRGEPTVARKVLEAELEEMRRTFRLIAGTTKEYFDLITELASDPADEKRKEPRNYVEFPSYAIGNLAEIKEPKE